MGLLKKIFPFGDTGIPLQGAGDELPPHQKTLFEAITRGVPDALILADTDHKILMCNPAMTEIFGYEESELLGLKSAVLYESPKEFVRQGKLRYHLNAEEKSVPYIVNYRRKNGEIFPGETVGSLIKDLSGNTLGYLGVIRDVTERVEAETALLEGRNNFLAAIDNMAESFALFDADDNLVQYNNKYLEAFAPELVDKVIPGISFEELVRIAAEHDFYPLNGLTKEEVIQDRLAKHRTPQGPFEIIRPDGQCFVFNESKIPGGGTVLLRRNITQRKQAETELQKARDELEQRVDERTQELWESEAQFRAIVDSSPAGIILRIPDGHLLMANKTFCQWMRVDPSEIEGKPLSDFFTKEEADEINAFDREVFETGEPGIFERQRSFRDGVTRMILGHKNLVFSDTGDVIAISTVMTDITERKIAEEDLKRRSEDLTNKVKEHLTVLEALSHSEGRLRNIMENIIEGIITIDSNGIIESFNPAAEKMFGYNTGEVLGENVSILTDEPDRPAHDRYLQNYLETGVQKIIGTGYREVIGRRKDDTTFPAELTVSEMRQRPNHFFIGTIHDITERKHTELKIQLSQARLSEAQRIARMGNWEWNLKTGGLYWSDEIYKIFGMAPGAFEATYEAFLKTVHPDDRELVQNSVEEALMDKKAYDIDHRIVLPDGTERVVNEQGEVTFSADGKPLVMNGTVQDITERKKAELDILKEKERAEFANRTKTEFLAHMSHELRTPLNAILGYSHILKGEMFGPLGNEKYAEYVENISQAGGLLLDLLSDILDVSKVDAGELEIEEEDVDIAAVFKECRVMVLERADMARVGLSMKVEEDLPKLFADRRRLKQILLNLQINAVKFTPEKGKIVVSAALGRDGGISLRVSDTGIGIAPENIPKILQPFGQVTDAYVVNNPGEGIGLGLSLVNSLVELHGGKLDIDSALGEGTRVSVTFPPERTLTSR